MSVLVSHPAKEPLFTPIAVGLAQLRHRVVLAPMTRYRANTSHVPVDMGVEYYAQRASTPGTLLITEGTFPSADAGGLRCVPGIWNDAQVEAWRRVEWFCVVQCVGRGLMGR